MKMELTMAADLNFSLCLPSSARRRSAAFRTPGSRDVRHCTTILVVCSFLCRLTREGRARPPFLAGRKRIDILEDLVRPAHFFRAFIARGCTSHSNHIIGKSSTSRAYESLGKTRCLKSWIFCGRVRGVSSIAVSIR